MEELIRRLAPGTQSRIQGAVAALKAQLGGERPFWLGEVAEGAGGPRWAMLVTDRRVLLADVAAPQRLETYEIQAAAEAGVLLPAPEGLTIVVPADKGLRRRHLTPVDPPVLDVPWPGPAIPYFRQHVQQQHEMRPYGFLRRIFRVGIPVRRPPR